MKIIYLSCIVGVLFIGCAPQSPAPNKTSSKTHKPKTPKSSLPGLTNLGNTCFANASLNLIFNASLVKELIKKPLKKEYNEAKKTYESDDHYGARMGLQAALKNFYQARKQQKSKLCTEINAFFDAYEKAREQTKGSPLVGSIDKIRTNQADASEFLNDILELLQGQRLLTFNYNEFQDGSVKTYKTMAESMLQLNVPPQATSISDLMAARNQPEDMVGANQVENEHGVKMDSKRVDALEHPAPQSLIIMLKRYSFDFDTQTSERVATEVIPNKRIAVTSFKKSEIKKGPLVDSYDLRVIVVHSGASPRGGHYYAYVFDAPHKQWVLFDDAQVSKVSEDDVMKDAKNNGYMFLYEKAP